MFAQLLATIATVYGVLGAFKTLLQTRRMLARRTSGDVSAGFLASYAGGYAVWLAYGLSTGSIPLIVVDAVGLLCGGLTLAVALSLRGSLIRPATWNSRNTTSTSPRPAAPDPQPHTHYLDEAEYLADRITVLCAGHIVAEGTPATLGGRDHMTTAISFTLPGHVQARDLPPGLSPLTEPGPGGSTVVHSSSPLVHLQMLGNWALGRGFDLPDLDVHRPTLEEVYLSLTGPASTEDQR